MDGLAKTECWERKNTVEGHPAWPCSHHQPVPPVPPEPGLSYSQAVLGDPWHLGSQVVLEDPAKKDRRVDGPALNISVTQAIRQVPTHRVQLLLWAISQAQVLSARCQAPGSPERGGEDQAYKKDAQVLWAEGRRGPLAMVYRSRS